LSTILKALKRIEQTTPSPEDLQDSPRKIDTKKAVGARVHKIWLHRKVYLAIILVVIMTAAGWLVYSQKHRLASKIFPQQSSANAPVHRAKIYPASDESKDAAPQKAPAQNQQNRRSGAEPGPRAVNRPPRGLPQLPASQKQQKNPIYSSTGTPRPPETNITAKPNMTPPPAAGSAESVQRDVRPSAAAPETKSVSRATPTERSFERLDESKLKLQAIAWSKEAAQRIAVINGHVVREGESVDGFVVNQIRREDVVVNDGTASWQLEFGLK